METLNAYRDHGEPKARLEEDVAGARQVLARLPEESIRPVILYVGNMGYRPNVDAVLYLCREIPIM